jgi:RimJ/RimL family protein N-acetyltransferase
MPAAPEIETPRLRLRPWRAEHRAPFARLNADPAVMRHFPAPLSRGESDALVERIERHWRERGFGHYAAERRADGAFLGSIGLAVPAFEAHFTPCVEIGWRLAREYGNQGYATEGARAVAAHAFAALGLEELDAITVPANAASRRVMEKLGMTHDPADDFGRPGFAPGHPFRRHVLYRLRRPEG